jgi:hypothetical protein
MCNCKSYNWNIGEAPGIIMYCPFIGKDISIDNCISDVIKKLWDNNVYTLASCCGHNRTNPNIVINDCYNKRDIEYITGLLKEIDSRQWDIYQWRITKVNGV